MGQVYEIQVRPWNGKYRTRYNTRNWAQAVMYYNGINIGNGYRKRLLVDGKPYKKPKEVV
jgi:hypothetical protein